MRGCDIKLLRERSGHSFSNREMAQMLGITERTLINWESSDEDLSPPYQNFLGQIFEDVVITTAQETLDRLFEIVPAEHMALWFYLGHGKVVLFRNSARHHSFSAQKRSFQNDEVIKDLEDISLTTAPLAYAVTINDAGESICNNRYKSYKGTRYVHYLQDRTLESILKLPRFMKGPKPLYLLSLENKLFKNNDRYEILRTAGSEKLFTEADVETLTTALEEEEKKGLTTLLNMFFLQK